MSPGTSSSRGGRELRVFLESKHQTTSNGRAGSVVYKYDPTLSWGPDKVATSVSSSNSSQYADRETTHQANEDRVIMTRVGLRIPTGLSFDEWKRAGQQLSGIIDSSAWCLGDWLVHGKHQYPNRYMKAIKEAGLRYQTLRNYAWVSRRFSLDRRRSRLSFQHHAEVASLPAEQQDRWLDDAENNMWTRSRLRAQVRSANSLHDQTTRAEMIPRVQVASGRMERWKRAAHQDGDDFERWLLGVLDHAAEMTLNEGVSSDP